MLFGTLVQSAHQEARRPSVRWNTAWLNSFVSIIRKVLTLAKLGPVLAEGTRAECAG